MELNADFDLRVSVHSQTIPWLESPMAGVHRRMLDRMGDEVARATSIVRYAPNSHFSPHVHTGGEEFFVLEGVFQDEHGDYPAGSYIRNPPQSSHTPGSETGCVIFVKLWQFDLQDRTQIVVDTNDSQFVANPSRPGVSELPLFADDNETVSLEQWAAGASVKLDNPSGMEILVLEGGFEESGEDFSCQSWLRLPKGASTSAIAGTKGTKLWVKRDHLRTTPTNPNLNA